jgi:nucleoside phosphorylase
MSGSPVALVTALRAELEPLLGALRNPRASRAGGQRFFEGELDGRRAVLTCTGVGGRAASAGARRVLERLRALGWSEARVVVLGVAGGLSPSALLGEVFVFGRCSRFDPDDREVGRIELPVPAGAPPAQLVTLDRVVVEPAVKAELWRRLGAPERAAVDMETYYAAEGFAAGGRETLAVRAISDGPADALPAWLADCVGPGGGLSPAKVAARALVHPRSVPALLELRRRVALAAERLCTAVRDLLATLP